MAHVHKKRAIVEDDDSDDDAGPSKRHKALVEDDDDDDILVADDEAAIDYDSADDYDEDLFKGPEDRAELMAKTDLERETILADRFERKVRRDETRQMRAQMQQQRLAAKQQQQKQQQQQQRASQRKTSTTQDDKKAKLAALAAARQSKVKEREERKRREAEEEEDDDDDEGRLVEDDDDDDEYAGGSDDDEGGGRRRAPKKSSSSRRQREERGDEPGSSQRTSAAAMREREQAEAAAAAPKEGPAPFNNLERIRLTRQKLEKWITEPFFETAVPGCFVRIGIGTNDGRPTYRVAEIVGVKDGFKQYPIEKVETTKRIELQIGASKRYFQISFVSNSDFDIQELEKYGRIMKQANLPTKTLTEVNHKVDELKKCKTHVYSEKEVGEMVARGQTVLKMKGNLALRKIQMQSKIDAAKEARAEFFRKQQKGDIKEGEVEPYTADDVAKLEADFAKLNDKQEVEKKIDQKTNAESFRISDINNRNRQFQRSVEEQVGGQRLQAEIDVSAGRKIISDPFARLPVRPVIYWEVKSAKKIAEDAAAAAAAAASAAAASAAGSSSSAAAPVTDLTVDTEKGAASGSGEQITSPGFAALLDTPRQPGGADDDPLATGDATAEAEAEGAMPRLAGKRAKAHDIEIEIDIPLGKEDEGASAALPTTRIQRPAHVGGAGMRPAGGSSSGAPVGQRLSLKDYKKRIEDGG